MRTKWMLLCIVVALFVEGCALAPKYSRPALPVSPALPAAEAQPGDVPPATAWKEFVGDARLRAVIDMVLSNNRDLRTAALNAERLGAAYRIQRAELSPGVGVQATTTLSRVAKSVSGTGQAERLDEYTVNVGTASWELDLFGRIRSLSQQALNQYLAAEQVTAATRTSLIAATANTYLAYAADAENRGLAESTLKVQQHSYELISRSRDAGVASDLDVRQAQSQVEAARAASVRYAGLVELDRHALELLAGGPIPSELLPESLERVEALKGVTAGLSSDVLLRRPDVLAAEYQLRAANANIGAARAAYFPRITLTAGAGLLSTDLSELLKGSAGTLAFSPQLVAPIFTGGAAKAGVKAAKLGRDAAVAQYEKSIQVAFRETSDALSLRSTLTAQRQAEGDLVAALAQAHRLSEARYQAGIDGYLSVLVAQRALFGAQQSLVAVRLAEQQNLVTLYKVLGGGV